MKIFRTDMVICVTAYVKAETAQEAADKLYAYHMTGAEFGEGEIAEGMQVSGARFDDEDLPPVSISPAATIYFRNTYGRDLDAADFEEAE